ncbi:MAG: anti-phage dCTP deaminase [Desulfomicrobium sp.]|nr:anti-phage dCTP deaminase [Desulfomicrobium sp.]
MSLHFSGTREELKEKLEKLEGDWDDNQPNKAVLRLENGVMNWFETTGTINFQGRGPGKEKLEMKVPKLLYPSEDVRIPQKDILYKDSGATSKPYSETKNLTIEQQYLTKGINQGELIIGIVSAMGAESKQVIDTLTNRLEGFDYEVHEVRVSSCLPKIEYKNEYERINRYISEGDNLRKTSGSNAILAAGVAKQISKCRTEDNKKLAYIINSLKHPDEVDYLRKIYGNGFYVIGIHADEKRRRKYLTEDKRMTQEQAKELIKIDENEGLDYGQKTRDTYHLADFFLNLGSNTDHVKNRIQRFLELIFSHPYKNPTFDEFAMFIAFNCSVHSSDLSRQVGAVIARNKQIIATGANDVPKSGGGLYWAKINKVTGEIEDTPDGKDYTREVDSNKQTQSEIITEIIKTILASSLVDKSKEPELKKILKESTISDLTEFGRVVHAEMDALLSCGRAGIPTVGTTLYCTTFPCHNCAKHIIASGVKRVVYVEPYPKSRALDFHSESIKLKTELDSTADNDDGLVIFEPFTGVGPRRFLDLFSMSLGSGEKLRRKDKSGKTVDWEQQSAPIRTPLIPTSYKKIEQAAIKAWDQCAAEHFE